MVLISFSDNSGTACSRPSDLSYNKIRSSGIDFLSWEYTHIREQLALDVQLREQSVEVPEEQSVVEPGE